MSKSFEQWLELAYLAGIVDGEGSPYPDKKTNSSGKLVCILYYRLKWPTRMLFVEFKSFGEETFILVSEEQTNRSGDGKHVGEEPKKLWKRFFLLWVFVELLEWKKWLTFRSEMWYNEKTMDSLQFLILTVLLSGNTLLQWMRFVIEKARFKLLFNHYSMDLDRFMDGDEKVREKLAKFESKMNGNNNVWQQELTHEYNLWQKCRQTCM